MGNTTRVTAETATPELDQWTGGQMPPELETPQDTSAQMSERRAAQAAAEDQLGWATHQIAAGVQVFQTHLALATERATDELDYVALAETVDWLQNVKRTVGELEAYVARELGRMDSTPEFITLSDGRRAEVMKGRERKAWRHEDWKRDVINALVPADVVAYVPDAETGEARDVDVAALIAKAQAVHGSTAPKSTALKALDLSADDYCTSGPGPYSVKVSAPATDTTEEN